MFPRIQPKPLLIKQGEPALCLGLPYLVAYRGVQDHPVPLHAAAGNLKGAGGIRGYSVDQVAADSYRFPSAAARVYLVPQVLMQKAELLAARRLSV